MRYTSVVLVFLICFCSCNEEHTTTVQGKVINKGSRKPVAFAKVRLSDGISSSGGLLEFEMSSGETRETITDEAGRFRVSITGEYVAFLSIGKEGYEFIDDSDGLRGYSPGTHKHEVLEITASATFTPTFVNGSATPCEILRIYTDRYSNPLTFALTPDVEFTGNGPYPYNTYMSKYFYGDMYTYYKLEFMRGGEWHEVIDSVVVESFKTFSEQIVF